MPGACAVAATCGGGDERLRRSLERGGGVPTAPAPGVRVLVCHHLGLIGDHLNLF